MTEAQSPRSLRQFVEDFLRQAFCDLRPDVHPGLPASVATVCITAGIIAVLQGQQSETPGSSDPGAFRFSTGIELVNVTATVSDVDGHFVPGLRRDDFAVYENGRLQTVTHFNADRVPVSLGVVLDTSGSMSGEKILAARQALDRFLGELLAPEDQLFLYRFSDKPELMQGWTSDRRLLAEAVGRLEAEGGTALYDTLRDAIPLADTGEHVKKALVIISDGNDTSSKTDVSELKRLIRESEVIVYAIGIDGDAPGRASSRVPTFPRPWPIPRRLPPDRRWPQPQPQPQPIPGPGKPGGYPSGARADERVNVSALRELTDESGGRTEIVREARDLDPATADIADELSRQYYLGYPASGPRDGQWREIRVEVRSHNYRVRARRGYVAN